jgi:hypothetical protein
VDLARTSQVLVKDQQPAPPEQPAQTRCWPRWDQKYVSTYSRFTVALYHLRRDLASYFWEHLLPRVAVELSTIWRDGDGDTSRKACRLLRYRNIHVLE